MFGGAERMLAIPSCPALHARSRVAAKRAKSGPPVGTTLGNVRTLRRETLFFVQLVTPTLHAELRPAEQGAPPFDPQLNTRLPFLHGSLHARKWTTKAPVFASW